jgi:sialate O-acetylesterase
MNVLISIVLVLVTSFQGGASSQKDFILMLNGQWKFQIGDNPEWANTDFDDTDWETITVPSTWEDQGFFGYDGFAWYRREFSIKGKDIKNKNIYVSLGYIDDADQVYINGKLIGFSGTFPPHFSTALEVVRKYPIPVEFLNLNNKNVISVRVYDHHMSGGIASGEIGIYTDKDIKPEISLNGLWKFRAGDNMIWKSKDHNDKSWRKIVVPGNWKTQGYKDFDGIAWYRRSFIVSEDFDNQKVVLILGRIELCDEVYVNGEKIGSSGTFPELKDKKDKETENILEECYKPRVYLIPENLIFSNKENSIAIRVLNDKFRGGIVEGPVGFIRLSVYNKLVKDKPLNSEE